MSERAVTFLLGTFVAMLAGLVINTIFSGLERDKQRAITEVRCERAGGVLVEGLGPKLYCIDSTAVRKVAA